MPFRWREGIIGSKRPVEPLAFALYGNQPYNKAVEETIMATARKIERIEARLKPAQKERIEYAASLTGTSVSDFMVQSAEAAAPLE